MVEKTNNNNNNNNYRFHNPEQHHRGPHPGGHNRTNEGQQPPGKPRMHIPDGYGNHGMYTQGPGMHRGQGPGVQGGQMGFQPPWDSSGFDNSQGVGNAWTQYQCQPGLGCGFGGGYGGGIPGMGDMSYGNMAYGNMPYPPPPGGQDMGYGAPPPLPPPPPGGDTTTGNSTQTTTQEVSSKDTEVTEDAETTEVDESALPKEYRKEMERQRAFETVNKYFGEIDNAAGQKVIGNKEDGQFNKKDLEAFLEKKRELNKNGTLSDEDFGRIEKDVNFMLENYDDFAKKGTAFSGNTITKDNIEQGLTLGGKGGGMKSEQDASLWPGWNMEKAGDGGKEKWPTPPAPHNEPKATWEEQKAFNATWAKNQDIGTDGTKRPTETQVQNYIATLAYEAGLDPKEHPELKELGHKYLNPSSGFINGTNNWHEDARNEVANLKTAVSTGNKVS